MVGLCWVGDAELVVGNDPELVAGGGRQVLVGDGVLLDGATLSFGFRFPLVFIYKKQLIH